MAKPQVLCKLTEGKLLSTFEHFVETWNWIVDCWDNLKGEDGITVEGLDNGQPVVKGGGSGSGGVAKLISGPDSNIVLEEVPDPEDGTKTVTQIDVYYV